MAHGAQNIAVEYQVVVIAQVNWFKVAQKLLIEHFPTHPYPFRVANPSTEQQLHWELWTCKFLPTAKHSTLGPLTGTTLS